MIRSFQSPQPRPPEDRKPPRDVHDQGAAIDRCQCGHTKAMHPGFFGQPVCTGTVDARHPSVGGDTLSPCQCKGFVAIIGLTNKVMTGGLDG